MSSCSSSDYSDEDLEATRSIGVASSASNLKQVVELAQICSFCTTFRQPLRLPSFSRTDLQEAILSAPNGESTHVELLAELHFKLAREHPSAKLEKMVQDWEKTLSRKLQDNWRKEFTANPMAGGVRYRDLTALERVKILDALCHWKLETCAEIQKHVATLQKENNNDAIERLRAGEIGMDDKGVSYWYFHDGCWVYAEDKSRWQLEERKQSYMVEFASAKRIRLSVNFDPDRTSFTSPLHLPVKKVGFADALKEKEVKEEVTVPCSVELEIYQGGVPIEPNKVELGQTAVKAVEPKNRYLIDGHSSTERNEVTVKQEDSTAVETISGRRVETNALRTSVSQSSDEGDSNCVPFPAGPHQSNGFNQNRDSKNVTKAEEMSDVTHAMLASAPSKAEEGSDFRDESNKMSLALANKSSRNEEFGKVYDNVHKHPHSCVVALVGSRKRTIVDDDSSNSSNSEVESVEQSTEEQVVDEAATSLPLRKKRKPSFEANHIAKIASAGASKDQLSTHGPTIIQVPESDTKVVEASSPTVMAKSVPTIPKNANFLSKAKVDAEVNNGSSLLAAKREEIDLNYDGIENSIIEVKKTKDAVRELELSRSASKSPADPDAAPEMFDITCESCKKCYDMRYVDPPLVERPTEEWRCFECLVNDARGWPRRRKSALKEAFSSRGNDVLSRKRGLSSNFHNRSMSMKSTKKSASKGRPSLSSRTHSSHVSFSQRKSSSSKSCLSKKSSSSKKRKKRKSSASSHRHHSSHGHRRRHHSHYHHAEFARLVALFHERQEQRLGIEEARIRGDLQIMYADAPQNWRVVSSTLEELQGLIESLSGGSLEQNRLRGRLISILKDEEKFDEQRRKQQELAWNILPRRQSSRIAIGRMKYQSAHDSDAEDKCSDDGVQGRRLRLRSRRSHSATSEGVDEKQKLDRACRARRRHIGSDDEEEDDVAGTVAGDWIDWSLVKRNARSLTTVCLAFVNRLLKEKAAELFSRPVNPHLDGCPNYLSVITHPMDLGTIRSRVENSFYRKWKLFKRDVELVWQNCRTYNASDTLVVQFANELSKLSHSMSIAAEKKGVDHLKDRTNEDLNDSDNHQSDVSKVESCSSINKAWTESSASESSDSSDSNSSSHADRDRNTRSHERRNTRTSFAKSSTRTRSFRTTRTPANRQSSRSCMFRDRPVPPVSSKVEISASENDVVLSRVQKKQLPVQKPDFIGKNKFEPPTEDEDSSGSDSATGQNNIPLLSPPPPPPLQVVQKRSKPRLIISDSSSSVDSSDSGNSSTSSSSDTNDSDSDARSFSKHHQPPPPICATPAPPPRTPPVASPVDGRSQEQASMDLKVKVKNGASRDGKTTAPSAPKPDASSTYAQSPPLLNSYLSPSSSSSSSSDISSNDSDPSDGDSESD